MENYRLQLCKIMTKVIELNKQDQYVKFEVHGSGIDMWHYNPELNFEIINHVCIFGVDKVDQYYKLYDFLEGVKAYVRT